MNPLNLVNRLIWREILGPLVNSFFMFTILVFATAHLFTLTDFLVRGADPLSVAKLAMLSLPMLVIQTLPMSMLLASLLSFGRLSADSEHIALFAGGISFFRIMWPVAVVGVIVSAITFVWSDTVVPPATREFMRLKQEAVEKIVTTGQPLKYNIMQRDRLDEFVNVQGGYDAKGNWFRQVLIVKMSDDPQRIGQPDFCLYADRARPLSDDPKGLDWLYENLRVVDLRPDPRRKTWPDVFMERATTSTLKGYGAIGMKNTFKGILRAERPDNRSMTFQELRDKIIEERAQGNEQALADEFDLWGKLSMPLASLIFGLVGAPFGVRPHRGSKAMGFGIAVGIIFLYWVLYQWMFVVGKSGTLPPMLASFVPDIAGVAAAVLLMARTRQ